MSDQEEIRNDVVEEFNFDEWAGNKKLSRKVTQILRQEELTTKDTLKLLQDSDLKQLGLPLGAVKTIMVEINNWNCVESVDNCDNVHQENVEVLNNAGKTLDALLSSCDIGKPKCQTLASPFMDPRAILTVKATNKKAVHVTQFLSEETKRRRQNRRQKEFVLHTNSSTFSLRNDDGHPYLGIYIDEWGAANMRVLNYLLSSGQIIREEVEYYLAYSTKIFEFAKNYEWNTILHFDFQYRELQAEHGFKWGTYCPHMEMQTLVPKRPAGRSTNQQQQQQSHHQQQHMTKEECRIFKAKGACPFGSGCRYTHKQHKAETSTPIPSSKN